LLLNWILIRPWKDRPDLYPTLEDSTGFVSDLEGSTVSGFLSPVQFGWSGS